MKLFLLAFLVLTAIVVQVAAQTATTVDGYQLEVTLKSDKETIMVSEPTFFSLEIKNYSAQNLCVGEGGDYRNALGRPDSYKVTVTRDDGKPVPQPEAGPWMGGFSGCSPIPAHGSRVVRLFLPHWATFESPGSYTINVRKPLSIWNSSAQTSSVVPADVSTIIKVVPNDENKTGEVIHALGCVMLDISDSESGPSAQALAHINDKRVIAYFAQALEKFNRAPMWTEEYDRSRLAAAALSRFNDDSAVAALEAVMKTSVDETRLDIASALERSEHPKALEILLRMQNDSYWFVRLRVAQRLSRTKSQESLALLRKMLKDENEEVRAAAGASINTRERRAKPNASDKP